MRYKLLDAAQQRLWPFNGYEHVIDVLGGVRLKDGIKVIATDATQRTRRSAPDASTHPQHPQTGGNAIRRRSDLRYDRVVVAFTFDDGPDVDATPAVLEALSAAGVKATFFVVAEQIESPHGPELLQAILDGGHVIQAHCGTHISHVRRTRAELDTDAKWVLAALARTGVAPPCLWRPPYGALNRKFSCQVAASVDLQLLLWTYNTNDWTGRSAGAMLHDSVHSPLYADSVILMHDSRRYARNKDTSQTIELIAPLAASIRARGFEMGALESPLPSRPRLNGEDVTLLPCDSATSDAKFGTRRFGQANRELQTVLRRFHGKLP